VKTPRLVVGITLSASFAACGRGDEHGARLRAEKQLLERQIAGLKELVAAAEGGTLTKPEQLLVAADEATVQGLLAATLPQERVVADRFRVRLERATVQFRASQGLVLLSGRASFVDSPGSFVEVTLEGGLEDVKVREASGTLVGRIAVYHLAVARASAAGADSSTMRALAEGLGRERLESLSALAPPLEIPIRLEESVAFKGFEDGPVSVRPGSLPVRASVARVLALSGRLWVVLDVGAGPWRAGAEAGG
jgi:hypothetical protein